MTTPTRRIRNARLRYARSHAAARAQRLTARLRSKDIVISAIAQSAVDAEAAADALRMERDAAHEECARLTAAHEDRARLAASVAGFRTTSAEITAARLVQVICEDADRIATLTAERDHARAIAVALIANRVPMDSDRTAGVEG